MDKISELPDESLIKILSFLPTKLAVSTSVLSKRWEYLWMWLPKLEYDDNRYSQSECERLRCFIHRSLPLHKAPVLESLCIKFGYSNVKPEDINMWIVVAVSRCVRELEISYFSHPKNPILLPNSLCTSKSLVVLKIAGHVFFEVPSNVCLPSLKTLQLRNVAYADEESFHRILSMCLVLEDLLVDLKDTNKMNNFTVSIPSLQRLTLCISKVSNVDGFVINTPSLVYFKLDDRIPKRHCYVIENMPKLVEAYINVALPDVKSLIGSITSVKGLMLCLGSSDLKVVYGDGFVFNQLEHLKLCVCSQNSSNLIVLLLNNSPNLRTLELFITYDHFDDDIICWDEPTLVPEPTMVPQCVLSSLQIFKWSSYLGSPAERDFAVYIIENARRLKTAIILFSEPRSRLSKLEMLKELKVSSRASSTCKLAIYL